MLLWLTETTLITPPHSVVNPGKNTLFLLASVTPLGLWAGYARTRACALGPVGER